MPNWTNTRMAVSGTEEDVKDFISKILVEEREELVGKFPMMSRTEIRIFESLVPCPKELFDVTSPVREEQSELAKQMMDKYGATDWYSWQYENWGVKWGDCHTFVDSELEPLNNGLWEVVYVYDLPWGSGDEAHKKISAMFPKLRFAFDFDEEAGFFAGCHVMKAGKILFEQFFEPCNWDEELADDATDEQQMEYWDKHSEWRNDMMSKICEEADKVGWEVGV